jgi:hypothetical protein
MMNCEDMLALVIAVTLSQCSTDFECKGDRICVDGRCVNSDAPRSTPPVAERLSSPELRARRETLLAQRPSLVPPIISLCLGGALAAATAWASGDITAGLGVGAAVLASAGSWFFAVLWARSRIGDMLEALQ